MNASTSFEALSPFRPFSEPVAIDSATGVAVPENGISMTIDALDFPEAQDRFAKLVKKATKLGLTPPEMVEASRYTKLRGEKNSLGLYSKWEHSSPHLVARNSIERILLHITGSAPNIEGWNFVAVIMHHGEISIVKTVDGEVELPQDRFRDPGPYCEHCNTKRRRNDTYVLEKDGEFVQVGRSCLKDFGGHNLEKVGRFYHSVVNFSEEAEDGYGGGKYVSFPSTAEYLAYVAYSIDTSGWLSKTNARERDAQSTSGDAWTIRSICEGFNLGGQTEDTKRIRAEVLEQWPKLMERANDAVAWGIAQETPEAFGYLLNLSRSLQVGYVDDKLAGLAASVFVAKSNAEEREIRRNKGNQKWAEQVAASDYVGEKKLRLRAIKAEFMKSQDFDGLYGFKRLHTFETSEGNVLIWWASSVPTDADCDQLKKGVVYTFDGTVKEHKEYKGLKQTSLSRCSKFTVAS